MLINSDTNCKSTLANCAYTDKRGNVLEYFMGQFGLELANQGDTWTFFTTKKQDDGSIKTYKSIIDYTIASSSICSLITGWHVSKEVNFSSICCLLLQNFIFIVR